MSEMISRNFTKGLISILMPVKNAAPFLSETLQSIILQSYPLWELIAVDDHSTDESKKILTHFQSREARIKLYCNSGNGILDALQLAQSKASGEMISRMDADDLMPPKRYQNQQQLLEYSGKNHLITGQLKYFSSSKPLQEGFLKYAEWLNHLSSSQNHYQEIYKECVIASPSWLMWSEDFFNIGGFEGLDYPEDYDFVFRLYKNDIEIKSVNDLVLFWRDHPERASRTLEQYRDQSFFSLKWKRFTELNRNPQLPIVLYGAGPKGKKLAKIIQQTDPDFYWVSGNQNKVKHIIYEKEILNEHFLKELQQHFQLIVAISSPAQLKEAQKCIPSNADIFYFC